MDQPTNQPSVIQPSTIQPPADPTINEHVIFENTKYPIEILWENEKPLFRASDIANILEIKDIHTSIRHFGNNEKVLRSAKTAGGKQKTTFLTQNGCIRIIQRTRKELPDAMLKYFNIKEHRFTPAETEFAQNIKLAFENLEIHQNYRIGNFFVDLFIPAYNIIIEFDEPCHMQQPEEEQEDENRTDIILNLLREITNKEYGTMLRFKSNCNICEATSKIHKQITFYMDVMHRMEVLKLNTKYNRLQKEHLDVLQRRSNAHKPILKKYINQLLERQLEKQLNEVKTKNQIFGIRTNAIQKALNDITDWVTVKTWDETNSCIDSQNVVKITHGERFGSEIDWEEPIYSILVSEHEIDYGNNGISYIGFGGIPFHFSEGNGIWARCEDHEHLIKIEKLL